MAQLKHANVSQKIIAGAYAVQGELGYGFFEKVYKNALAVELEEQGLKCDREVALPVSYRGKIVGDYYADLIVEKKIIVEVKAVAKLESLHEVQLVNYLKATGLSVGLLINFGRSVEVKRRIFGFDGAAPS